MPNYDFKTLSDFDFELLVRDLLQEELGITLESFKQGKDSGIDLRFSQAKSKDLIVQCKHYASSSISQLLSHLRKKEYSKITLLSPGRYILATSLGLSPDDKHKIQEILRPYCRGGSDIFGREDLNNLLGKFTELEKRNFKLWMSSGAVLQRILHADTYHKSFLAENTIKQKISRYVRNPSYDKARSILDDKHYCIIAGIPGIGKTTLAEILCFTYMSDGYEFIKVTGNINEAFNTVSFGKKQVFYYDDFLGQTNLREKFGKNEEQDLLSFLRSVNKSEGTRFLLTTREHILNDALQTYEKLARAENELFKCIIDMRDYANQHRALRLIHGSKK